MPLPPSLSRRASKRKKRRRMALVMRDLKNGPHHKDRTRAQEIAIALEKSGQSNRTNGRRPRRRSRRQARRAARR